MKLYVGTSGFSYKEWKGHFYPENIPDKEYLNYYAGRFDTVEINNTFYRFPNEKTLVHWTEQVGDDFKFTIKASRRISHQKRIKNVKSELEYLFSLTKHLGDKMGPVLVQLQPNQKKDAERLKQFTGDLRDTAPDAKVTMEFRNLSWFDDETVGILRDADIAMCYTDGEVEGETLMPSAGWGYLRLRKVDYDEAMLKEWVDRIKEQKWQEVYVYFKHEDEGTGPKLALKFRELWGA